MDYKKLSTKQLVEVYGIAGINGEKSTQNAAMREMEYRWELFINSLDDKSSDAYRILTERR